MYRQLDDDPTTVGDIELQPRHRTTARLQPGSRAAVTQHGERNDDDHPDRDQDDDTGRGLFRDDSLLFDRKESFNRRRHRRDGGGGEQGTLANMMRRTVVAPALPPIAPPPIQPSTTGTPSPLRPALNGPPTTPPLIPPRREEDGYPPRPTTSPRTQQQQYYPPIQNPATPTTTATPPHGVTMGVVEPVNGEAEPVMGVPVAGAWRAPQRTFTDRLDDPLLMPTTNPSPRRGADDFDDDGNNFFVRRQGSSQLEFGGAPAGTTGGTARARPAPPSRHTSKRLGAAAVTLLLYIFFAVPGVFGVMSLARSLALDHGACCVPASCKVDYLNTVESGSPRDANPQKIDSNQCQFTPDQMRLMQCEAALTEANTACVVHNNDLCADTEHALRSIVSFIAGLIMSAAGLTLTTILGIAVFTKKDVSSDYKVHILVSCFLCFAASIALIWVNAALFADGMASEDDKWTTLDDLKKCEESQTDDNDSSSCVRYRYATYEGDSCGSLKGSRPHQAVWTAPPGSMFLPTLILLIVGCVVLGSALLICTLAVFCKLKF